MPLRTPLAINAHVIAGRILTYFDSYKIGAVAPIVLEIEQVIEAAFERGRERGFKEGKEWAKQMLSLQERKTQ